MVKVRVGLASRGPWVSSKPRITERTDPSCASLVEPESLLGETRLVLEDPKRLLKEVYEASSRTDEEGMQDHYDPSLRMPPSGCHRLRGRLRLP